MLNRQNRYSFKSGVPHRSVVAPFFVMRYQRNETGFKCAFVVSKKVSKRAVDRNRLKRTFSGILEKMSDKKNMQFSVVFYINKEALTADPSKIEREIEKALKNIT